MSPAVTPVADPLSATVSCGLQAEWPGTASGTSHLRGEGGSARRRVGGIRLAPASSASSARAVGSRPPATRTRQPVA